MPISISKNWNSDENYWVLNPIMKTIKKFSVLYEGDKTKNKDKSSRLMWAIALLMDPNDANPWRNISEDEKKELIAEDYLRDKKFNWDDPSIKELVDTYENFCLSLAEKELYRYNQKLTQRGDFIAKTTYTMDFYDEDSGKVIKGTADQLDKMMLNTGKIFAEMEMIHEKLVKELDLGEGRGGQTESASESKKI